MSTFTLTYTRYGALGLPEVRRDFTAPADSIVEEVERLLGTMTPGDTADLNLRHDLPVSHPLRTE